MNEKKILHIFPTICVNLPLLLYKFFSRFLITDVDCAKAKIAMIAHLNELRSVHTISQRRFYVEIRLRSKIVNLKTNFK